MPFVETNGINLYYEIHGQGPVVVLAHPGGGNHLSWWQQVPAFAQAYTCLTFDHRGHGATRDLPADDPGAAAYAQDLVGLLDHLGIHQTAIVGQSMGGWTAIGFAEVYPERVSALVLTNSTGGIRDPELDRHLDLLKTWHPRQIWAGAYTKDFSHREPARAFLYQQITAWNVRRPANLGAQLELVHHVEPIVEQQIPTLFLTSEEDILLPPQLVERVARQIPQALFVKIPGAGHSAYFEKPEEFNRIVLEFLQQRIGASPS
ncbi:MAG: alpha/beta hydrolase [Deltaproteobacteria bacterium]|nr:alpha/beta hydrolase [Deltaproteobacteria bacterium]